jgi:hypothetical protein
MSTDLIEASEDLNEPYILLKNPRNRSDREIQQMSGFNTAKQYDFPCFRFGTERERDVTHIAFVTVCDYLRHQ